MKYFSISFAINVVLGFLILNSEEYKIPGMFSMKEENQDIFTTEGRSVRCCGKYGCFTADSGSECVAIQLLPLCQNEINVKFYLWTRQNSKYYDIITVEDGKSLASSHILKGKITFIYVHGYFGKGDSNYILETKNNFLEKFDCNVISVDWSKGSIGPHQQASSNAQVVAAVIATLINMLVENNNIMLDNIHIIGHSLGAHVSGLTGKALGGLLYRITGLDPAKESFGNCPPSRRLNATDALFVDILHTDTDGRGLATPLGDLDIYVNGGKSQPDCELILGIATKVCRLLKSDLLFVVYCDHFLATIYFSESIIDPNPGIAYQCNSDDFNNGICPANCNEGKPGYSSPIGFPADVWRNYSKDSPTIMYGVLRLRKLC